MSQVPGSGSQWSPGGGGYMTTGGTAGRLATKGIIVGVPVALTVVSLVGVGKFLKAAGAIRAADAALVRLYQTGRIPWLGASTYYPPWVDRTSSHYCGWDGIHLVYSFLCRRWWARRDPQPPPSSSFH